MMVLGSNMSEHVFTCAKVIVPLDGVLHALPHPPMWVG